MELASIIQPSLYGCRSAQLPGCHESPHAAHWRDLQLHFQKNPDSTTVASTKDFTLSYDKKQDGSHEPECMHVLGLRAKTSATGKRTYFSCIVRAYRLSKGT
jgi:hypothetical protein